MRIKKFFRLFLALVGGIIGYSVANTSLPMATRYFLPKTTVIGVFYKTIITLLFGIISFYFSETFINKLKSLLREIELELELGNISLVDVFLSSLGLIISLIIAYLVSSPIYNWDIPYLNVVLPLFIYIVLGYIGITLPTRNRPDLKSKFEELADFATNIRRDNKTSSKNFSKKILDTSVIIDGRILDVTNTKFVEGPLVIPQFVLKELQAIADSSNNLKRARGRRGLDILKELQESKNIEVEIIEKDYEDIREVDSKLIKLAQDINGSIVTNDYNLNKVAEVQGISVLNINDLANALKPVILPGEKMEVKVIKEGAEANQGLAYLDDGTMIVVENGKELIGRDINIEATSVFQTSAGRMIFARPLID